MTFSATPAPGPAPAPRRAINIGALQGSREFYWVAGLSLVNSALTHFDVHVRFPMGLGITQVMDGIAIGLQQQLGGIAVAIAITFALLGAGFFALFGWLTGRGIKAALLIGVALYGLDGVLCLLFRDWFAVAFHAYILYKLIQAVRNFSCPAPTGARRVSALRRPGPRASSRGVRPSRGAARFFVRNKSQATRGACPPWKCAS